MTTKTIQLTRQDLIEVLVEYRMTHWDNDLQEEAIRYGRTGFDEMTDADLESYANEELSWPLHGPEYRIVKEEPQL